MRRRRGWLKCYLDRSSLVTTGWKTGGRSRRRLTDTILAEHILTDSQHAGGANVILIKGHAGAGKSVLLKRIAWDAARDYGRFCLFTEPRGWINVAAIQEILSLSRDDLYLFVDQAADRSRELTKLFRTLGPEGAHLTVVMAERVNEWNILAGQLADYVTDEYEITYLSTKEIQELLRLLEKHKALGELEKVAPEARVNHLTEIAGRQLLVALHEATLGKPFEEIIEDEFNNIVPQEARNLYLTICVLNRFDVPVRAGLISRTHSIPFVDFESRLFAPLEHVVQVAYDPASRDHMYSARHPHIAEMVFQQILRTVDERFDYYVRFVRNLNIEYSTDRRAFRRMLRARTLQEAFANEELVSRIYEAAEANAGADAYVMHQRAIYEMNRYGGDLEEAGRLLNQAAAVEPWNPSIKHSNAELRLRMSESARTPLERERLLQDAAKLAREVKRERIEESFGINTLVKVGISRLRDTLRSVEEPGSETALEKAVKEVESNLTDGLLEFPGDPYLLAAEAELATLLSDSGRAVDALRKAFMANPRNGFIAMRLAKLYLGSDPARAEGILKQALNANGQDKKLHYAYAKLLLTLNSADRDAILHHLRRSFTDGDGNYDAQLLYGRQLFVDGNHDGWRGAFVRLRNVRVPAGSRHNLLYPLDQEFRGAVEQIEAVYCWLVRDGPADRIFASKDAFTEVRFADVKTGVRVRFKIGFNFKGPSAVYVVPE